MDFDGAKENIQPLAAGRNASILQATLQESAQELLTQRQELEHAIHLYQGDDPLEVWIDYIAWIEQSFPSGGKESGLEEVLTKCLSSFENDSRYFQDRRMIKLYIKFFEMHKDQNITEFYQQLFSAGIGTMVSDFYISWAYCYDLSGNYRKADETFRRGIACRAEPIEELQEARKHFGFTVAQRFLREDDENATESANNQLEERRLALSSLRSHRKKVGSIRTGAAVKSYVPGTLKTSTDATKTTRYNNASVQVFTDEKRKSIVSPILQLSSVVDEESMKTKSVVRSIIDAARNQENKKEPGPWNKALDKKKGKLFGKTNTSTNIAFDILEDESIAKSTEKEEEKQTIKEIIVIDKPFKPFPNFKHKNRPLPEWITPVTIENTAQPGTYPQYNKCKLYPRPNREYQTEELLAYNWFCKRGISNKFTRDRDIVWKSYEIGPVRHYPNFAKNSRPRALDRMDEYFEPEVTGNLAVNFNELYNKAEKIEMQIEEVLADLWTAGKRKLKHNLNDTIMIATEMDETVCVPDVDQINRRKSFFPSRRSVAAVSYAARPSILLKARSHGPLYIPTPPIEETVEHENIRNENVNIEPLQSQESLQKENILHIAATSSDIVQQDLQKSMEGFKIFEDTEQPTTSARAKALNAIYQEKLEEKPETDKALVAHSIFQDSFEFKTPAAPATGGKPKISFEIYEEAKEEKTCGNPNQENCRFFEADETCSTQAFNLFIKSQSVSTPNAPQKTRTRVFGTILKDRIDPEPFEETSPSAHVTPNELADAKVCTEGAINYSPPCPKQLSTILETSEQGTHTKSSVSSPKTESLEAKGSRLLTSDIHLDTMKELSHDVEKVTHGFSQGDTEIVGRENSEVLQAEPHKSTPATTRLQNAIVRNFSIFEDRTESNVLPACVGNFSRLEEREDTTSCFIIQPIKFQEDKTETITKILSASKPIEKFQDEVTDTISKRIFIPAATDQFQEDKTETSDKSPFLPQSIINKPSPSLEDTFAFFTQTPPKIGKDPACQHSMLSPSEFCNFDIMDSPEVKAPKLKCNYNTPELRQKLLVYGKSNESSNKSYVLKASRLSENAGLSIKKSILKDYPTHSTNPEKLSPPEAEDLSKLKNSFMPEFSLIKEIQPQTAPLCTQPTSQTNDSFVKDSQPNFIGGSRLKTQPVQNARPKTTILDSFDLSDFSMVMDSQPSHVKGSKCPNAQVDNHEHILTDSYMKDFSAIKEPSPPLSARNGSKAGLKCVSDKPNRSSCEVRNFKSTERKSGIQFEVDSNANATPTDFINALQALQISNKAMVLQLDNDSNKMPPPPSHLGKSLKMDEGYEFNAETAQFAPNLSIIRNSTLLLNESKQRHTLFQEKSLHIKEEPETEENIYKVFKAPAPLHSSEVAQQNFIGPSEAQDSRCIVAVSPNLQSARDQESAEYLHDTKNTPYLNLLKTPVNPSSGKSYAEDYDNEMSIYVKHTPKTPKIQRHIWNDSNEEQQTNSAFVHFDADLNETQLAIEQICLAENVNPFNINLISAFLEQINFTNYINERHTCELIGKVRQLHKDSIVKVNDIEFKVQKLIGEGSYGAVYCATETKTGKKYALKQERPPNFWEYYICLEVHDRLEVEELIPAFMSVDYALIGRNSSILVSPFSTYGSLITVCNKIKKVTMRNVDEYVVMHITCLLLEMMDHLHALEIIHADIKADNFLLMQKLSLESNQSPIQLIDFGVSIDMRRFKKGQMFSYSHKDYSIKCVEMRENRPWTYQLDLYGLAGVIHVLLFGKYMDVHKISLGFWMHKTHVPRYFNKPLWDTIFRTLLNIQDCSSMPNLQNLRVLLKEEIAEKEHHFTKKIFEFNRALDC